MESAATSKSFLKFLLEPSIKRQQFKDDAAFPSPPALCCSSVSSSEDLQQQQKLWFVPWMGGGGSKLALREKTWRMSRFVDSLFQMGGFENERDPIDKVWWPGTSFGTRHESEGVGTLLSTTHIARRIAVFKHLLWSQLLPGACPRSTLVPAPYQHRLCPLLGLPEISGPGLIWFETGAPYTECSQRVEKGWGFLLMLLRYWAEECLVTLSWTFTAGR